MKIKMNVTLKKNTAWAAILAIIVSIFSFTSVAVVSAEEAYTYIIHYFRPDGNYSGWNLHTWFVNNDNTTIRNPDHPPFVKPTAPELFSTVSITAPTAKIGFIIRKSSSSNEWEEKNTPKDLFLNMPNGQTKMEVWVLQGDEKIYTTAPTVTPAAPTPVPTYVPTITGEYTYTFHYYRFDNDYTGWNLHTWMVSDTGSSTKVADHPPFIVSGSDKFAVASISLPSPKIGFIIRKSTATNDYAQKNTPNDLFLTMPDGQKKMEVWILESDPKIYFEEPSTVPPICAAFADSDDTILATVKAPITDASHFKVKNISDNVNINCVSTLTNSNMTAVLKLSAKLDPQKLYQVYTDNNEYKPCKVTMRKILDSYYDDGVMGLTYSPQSSVFAVWAPTAKTVKLALYDNAGTYGDNHKVADHTDYTRLVDMNRNQHGTWTCTVNEDLAGKFYMYQLSFADEGGKDKINYAVDPYSKAVSANGQRSAIVNLAATNPPGFNPMNKPDTIKNQTDQILYEVHVRDFSVSDDSGIPEEHKGKFLAFTDEGTTVPGTSVSTGIDHLKELGITTVHLLPVYDFNSVDELGKKDQFNWGYDPLNYNVPEGSYSTDPSNPATRITEFKQMVQAFHNNGLRVVMDVVYNHTANTSGTPFNSVVPGNYYYRTKDDGSLSNGSGCGNDVATERPMVSKYIQDSVVYWAKEYGIDGFRFDLMGLIDINTIKKIVEKLHAIDPSIIIYGEPWQRSGVLPKELQTIKGTQKNLGFAVFNDNVRNAIKGGTDDQSKGFATGEKGKEGAIVKGIMGSTGDFTAQPTESINYVTAHDNLCLWDKIVYSTTNANDLENGFKMLFTKIKNGSYTGTGTLENAIASANVFYGVDPKNPLEKNKVRMDTLANGIVLTMQGVPFIHAGEELLRTKYGDYNSYKSPDSINKIIWSNKVTYKPVTDYYRGLIKLRRLHPAFRMANASMVNSNIEINKADNGVVMFTIKNNANGDNWNNIVVIYNSNSTPIQEGGTTVALPPGKWNVVVDDKQAGTTPLREVSGSVVLNSFSMMVLYDTATGPESTLPQFGAGIKVILDGRPITFDQKPIMDTQNNRVLVPMRKIFEAFGANVEWDEGTKTIISTKGDLRIIMQINNNVMEINGNKITLDSAPQVLNGRTLVPVRAVSESLKAKVEWDGVNKTVIITTK